MLRFPLIIFICAFSINAFAHDEDLMLKMFQKVMDELQKCKKQNEEIKKQNEEIKNKIVELQKKVNKIINNQKIIKSVAKHNFAILIEQQCKKLSLKTGKSGFHKGNYYLAIETVSQWKDAKILCEQIKGHLVTIHNKQENDFLIDLANGNHFWIGLADEKQEDTFEWITQEKLSYTNWSPEEPNDTNNDCVVMLNTGSWNDCLDDKRRFYFICEWDNVLMK